jgi:1-acyl-sn-glycerol-3-phosphate acyltransferase
MKKKTATFVQKIIAVYALIIFVSSFFILYPFMFLACHSPKTRNLTHWLFRIWGYTVFILTGIIGRATWKFKPKKGEVYIFCANHASYADIPTLYIEIKRDLSFIGKSSLGKIPLFGYLYRKIHILVDRKNPNSRKEVIDKAIEFVHRGISPVIFPEGTIPKIGTRPDLIEFKDGAFKIAILTQKPIVPVAILNTYKILPDDNKMNIRILPSNTIFHEPIETKGMTLDDLQQLKQKTFDIIQNSINEHKKNT